MGRSASSPANSVSHSSRVGGKPGPRVDRGDAALVVEQPEVDVVERERQRHPQPSDAGCDQDGRAALGRLRPGMHEAGRRGAYRQLRLCLHARHLTGRRGSEGRDTPGREGLNAVRSRPGTTPRQTRPRRRRSVARRAHRPGTPLAGAARAEPAAPRRARRHSSRSALRRGGADSSSRRSRYAPSNEQGPLVDVREARRAEQSREPAGPDYRL